MAVNFYLCTLTVQNPTGPSSVFARAVIAPTKSDAIETAAKDLLAMLPAGCSLISGNSEAIKTELLERAAEQVLGWHRP